MIASDLDGTVIRADGTISDRTVKAFRTAREAGIHVVFVTGRPFRWLESVREAFGHLGTVICSNGALVYDLEAGRILKSKTVDIAALREVRRIILGIEPAARFAAETLHGLHLESDFVREPLGSLVDSVVPGPLDHRLLHAEGVVKFLAKSHILTPDEFFQQVTPAVGSLLSVTHSTYNVSLVEMAHPEVNKSVALEAYAAELGIAAEDVAAFGDMPNDVEMLAWAGRGYAMGSGHPLAQAAAFAVARTVEEDGVARVIEELLGL
ncbi:hydrolase [Zafaria cholistanensis]|uniref:Hydrolase n=1 Tax=Zafaria cholistanensis TaxID=1682741 RepID=A0A5A7NPR3_9MICC|nr:hydrolase [Zafaria cholistanensis]